MLSEPTFENRAAQGYAYITFTVRMTQMKKPADEGFPELFGWLADNGITPTGAPFFNYRRIDMANTLEVEAGVPVDRTAEGTDRVRFGQLPTGRYLTATHTGPYGGLYKATGKLIGWASERGLKWDVSEQADGDHFACRLEIYETDPRQEPDSSKWITRLVFKLAE